MRRGRFVLAAGVCVLWAGHGLFGQVIQTAPLGGGGVHMGPIGSGLSGGYNNPLGGSNLKPLDLGGTINTSVQAPAIQELPEAQLAAPAAAAVSTSEDSLSSTTSDESAAVVSQPVEPTSEQSGDSWESSTAVSAAGGGPPPEIGGDDDDDDDGDGDGSSLQDDDDDDDEVQKRKFNWWIWGPVAIVALIVVGNLCNRR